MKIILVVCFGFFFLIMPFGIYAQEGKFVVAYDKGEYDKCLLLCQKAREKDSKNLDAILFEAMAHAKLSDIAPEDPLYKEEYKKSADKALRSLSTLVKKDAKKQYISAHKEQYALVRAQIMKTADDLAAVDIDKAMIFYERIINELQDRGTYFYLGCSWLRYNDLSLGMGYLNNGLKFYYSNFKKGEKPEPEFTSNLMNIAEYLSEEGHYRHSFDALVFLNLITPEKKSEIREVHYRCIESAMNKLNAGDEDVHMVLKESEHAWKEYDEDDRFLDIKEVLIRNVCSNYSASSWIAVDGLTDLDSCFRYILDSMQAQPKSLEYINQSLLAIIHHPSGDKKDKSLFLYHEYLRINTDYSKQTKNNTIERFLNYTNSTSSLTMQGTALWVYRESGGNPVLFKTKLGNFENQLIEYINKFQDPFATLQEIRYWLERFPELEKLKESIHLFFLKQSQRMVADNEFSKATIILLWAQHYFPEDKEFKALKRSCVEKDYEINHKGSEFTVEELGWTGSVENCRPGRISAIAQKKTLQRYNFIRRMAYLPDDNRLDTSENRYCQAAALCMKAQNELSHNPDKSWKCYSEDAARGAHNSLGLGIGTSDCIDQMIRDDGENNKATGHRGNLLTASYARLVYGATDYTVSLSACDNYHRDSVQNLYDKGFISWPPPGPVPNTLIFNRWSFKPYDYSFRIVNPKVKMYLDGKQLQLEMQDENTSKIVWWPSGIDKWAEKEQTIKVIIEIDAEVWNIDKQEYIPSRKSFEYEVIIFPVADIFNSSY